MSFLGIDLGTSFLKGAVLDVERRKLGQVIRKPFPEPISNSDPLRCEFDPEAILRAFRSLIDELAPSAPHCEGIVMCAQMHGLVLMNQQRQAVSNCITWRDQRAMAPHPSGSGTYLDAILARVTRQDLRQLGNELEAARPICFLFCLKGQGELVPGSIPASLPDFVISAMSGEPPGVDATNASAYGAFNLETSGWHQPLISRLGLDQLAWPKIRTQREVAGHLKVGSRLVPCYAPVGDAQAALLGSLLSAEELSLNIATGAQVSRLTDQLCLGDYQTRPYFDGQFLNTLSYPPAGRELNALIGLLKELATEADPWKKITEEVGKVTETDLEIDLNFFPGPDGTIGNIEKIRVQNLSVGHLFRAAFRCMADSYYRCALKLWPDKRWSNLVFSGGLVCKMPALREAIGKRFARSYRLTPETEDTLLGLLILACVCSG
ncbi:MAG TPA: FGGY family carbohydrate kinase, partial [Candidatus Binatia bacterium]|nr:FGGY family carbohydrate kinase [Candidatus Binatia bacterium]